MTRATDLKQRRYDLDWLRVMAILTVLLYHVGMFFVSWDYHIKNNDTTSTFPQILEHIMVWLHQWRMPLLLFISGAGTIYATSRRTTKQFVTERHKRLFFPLIFAMFVIVPPQIYLEKISQFASFFDFYPKVLELIPYPEGNFSWHHMWFVLYLLVYSMLAIPLIVFLKSDKSNNFLRKSEKFLSKKWGFISVVIPIVLSQIILRPYFPEETHGFIDDWAYFTFYFFFFIGGIIVASSNKLWTLLKENRRFHLYIGLVSLFIMEALYINWKYSLNIVTVNFETFWELNKIICAWAWVITVIGYGQVYMNRKSEILKKMNEGIYPFYILHQTVILLLAFPMINWIAPVFVKFVLLALGSFIITVAIYLLFIKPFNIMRFLFGMKPKGKLLPKKPDIALTSSILSQKDTP
jgi:peptidoglycan/LPS O-acetylase OafA/YrhL